LDIADIAAFVIEHFPKHGHGHSAEKLLHSKKLYEEARVKDVVGIATYGRAADEAQRLHFPHVPASTTLRELLRVLSHPHVNRLAVVDADGRVTTVVTHSTVVKFIAQHLDRFPGLGQLRVSALPESRPMYTIHYRLPVIEAFDFLVRHHVGGVGLVGDTGALEANLSVKDIKFGVLHYETLLLPTDEFVHRLRQASMFTYPPAVYVRRSDDVTKLLAKFTAAHLHRLYTEDEGDGPQENGVLSVGDVVKFLATH